MKNVARFGSILLLVAVLFLALASPASADITVSVAPSLVEVAATGAGQAKQELTVFNDGSEAFEVIAAVQPYKQATGSRSAIDWLKVTPERFELMPGQKQQAVVTVDVPAGVEAGGRYASVTFKTGATTAASNRVGVAGQLGVPFLVTVGGANGLIRQANLDRLLPLVELDGRMGFRAGLANQGNLHVVSRGGEIAVERADGSQAGKLSLPESTAILPDSSELLAAQGTIPWQEGSTYRARALLDYGGASRAGQETSFVARTGLSVQSLSARENNDKGPTLALELRNEGELGLLPRIQFAVRGADGKVVAGAQPGQPPLLWPGKSLRLENDFPQRLPSGNYTLLTRIDYVGKSIEREASLAIGSPLPVANPAWGAAPARQYEPENVSLLVTLRPFLIALIIALVVLYGVNRLPVLSHLRRRSYRAMRVLWGAE